MSQGILSNLITSKEVVKVCVHWRMMTAINHSRFISCLIDMTGLPWLQKWQRCPLSQLGREARECLWYAGKQKGFLFCIFCFDLPSHWGQNRSKVVVIGLQSIGLVDPFFLSLCHRRLTLLSNCKRPAALYTKWRPPVWTPCVRTTIYQIIRSEVSCFCYLFIFCCCFLLVLNERHRWGLFPVPLLTEPSSVLGHVLVGHFYGFSLPFPPWSTVFVCG